MLHLIAEDVTTTSLITEGMKTAFENGVKAVQTDVSSMVTLALPAGMAIMGLFMAIRLGVGFFRSLAN